MKKDKMKPFWLLLGILGTLADSAIAPDTVKPGSNTHHVKGLPTAKLDDELEKAGIHFKVLNASNPVPAEIDFRALNEQTKLVPVMTINTITVGGTGTTVNIEPETAITAITKWGIGTGKCPIPGQCTGDYGTALVPTDLPVVSNVIFTDFNMGDPSLGNQMLVAVSARDGNDDVMAFGSVAYTPNEISATIKRVGSKSDGNVALKVTFGNQGITFTSEGTEYHCTVSPCYCVGLNPTSEAEIICKEVDDLRSGAPTFQMCGETVIATDALEGIGPFESVSLMYSSDTVATLSITTPYDPTPNTVEVLYYKESDKDVKTPNVCSINGPITECQVTDVPPDAGNYKILLVSTNGQGLVDGSTTHNFEDYKMEMVQVSDKTIEARWTTSTPNAVFNIIVDDILMGTVTCFDTNCKGYASDLTTGNSYTVSVELDSLTPGTNTVGASLTLKEGAVVDSLTISKLLKTAEDIGSSETTIEVTVDKSVTGMEDVTLALLAAGTPVTEYVYQHSLPEITGGKPISFTVNSDALQAGTLTVVVVAHGTGNAVLASGEATFNLQAITTVIDQVGASDPSDPFSSLRVNTDAAITVEGSDCGTGTTYILGANAPNTALVEVCDAATTPPNVCDNTRVVNPFTGPIGVTNVTLTLDADGTTSNIQVSGTFNTNSTTMDLVFYEMDTEATKVTCNISKDCETAVDRDLLTNQKFQLLMVALKDNAVTESNAIDFEDYATTVTQLTVDLIEVRWSAAADTMYQISLDRPVTGAYDTVTVTCGAANNNKCKAYFMLLLQEQYVASVQLKSDGNLNIVAATVVMMPSLEEALTIISLELVNQGDTLLASVCFEDNSSLNTTAQSYELLMIDRSGNTRTLQTTPDADFCITGLDLSTTFNTAAEVRVLVIAENDTNRIAGDAELFLLDPNEQNNNAQVSVKQVGQTTLRAKWTNLNHASSYQITHDAAQEITEVQCGFNQECGRYIHLDSNSLTAVTVTITENGEIQQTLSINVNVQNSVQDIIISNISPRWDDRIQVCFEAPLDVSSYELGLEVSNELLEATQAPQIISSDDGSTCLLSEKTVELGAYVELWGLVSAYDAAGNLKASGVMITRSIFLSASRAVYGAVSNTSLITSWHLLDSTNRISQITVILKTLMAQGTEIVNTDSFQPEVTSNTYVSMAEGKYTICVRAAAEDIYSEEICSDIIQVLGGQAVVVPPVETTPPKTTSDNGVLVTWQPSQDEDVTGFLISWTPILGSKVSRSKLNSQRIEDDSFRPLDLVRVASIPRVSGGTEFKIVSASETSVEITGLSSNQKYSLCVASVKEDAAGPLDCNESDLSQHVPLDEPTDLNYENGGITWVGDASSNYLVKWQSQTDKRLRGYNETSGTSYQKKLEPGQWDIEIRAVTEASSSNATKSTIMISGLVASAKQSQQNSLVALWYEEATGTPAFSNLIDKLYEIKISKNGYPLGQPIPKYCSAWVNTCSLEIQNLNISSTDKVVVTVTDKDANNTAQYRLKIQDFTEITLLSQSVRSTSDVTITWNEVPEAAKYKTTLYKYANSTEIRSQEFIPMTSLQLTLPNMMGNMFTVQACTDEDHCGNLVEILLQQNNGNTGPSKTTIIIASTVGVVLGVCLIVLIAVVLKKQSKKTKRRGNRSSRRDGEEPQYDEWGKRALGQSRRANLAPEEIPRSPSSRQNYGIPSTFDMHS